MKLNLWQIDAFAEKPLEGNPAAVVPLETWLGDTLMQRIANENNLAETAFFVKEGPGRYRLRWFTPTVEVDLCGHATLASAWLVLGALAPELQSVEFETRSGTLTVTRESDGQLQLALPASVVRAYVAPAAFAERIGKVLQTTTPSGIFEGRYLMAVFDDAKSVRAIPGPGEIASVLPPGTGLTVTAPGDEGFDFISRFFAPHHGIPEDPVTGSAHCDLTAYWSKRLDKKTMRARQVSPRGGNLICTDNGARALLSGSCALYLKGEISV